MEVFESVTFYVRYNGNRLEVKAVPYDELDEQDIPIRFQIIIGEMPQGLIERKFGKWESGDINDRSLLDAIVTNIHKYYE
jgi:hypothetical protein